MSDDNYTELFLKCRCADCETEKRRLCQSGQLKVLIGDLFSEEQSPGIAQGLYCRRKPMGAGSIEEGAECLCTECELATSGGGYFCLEEAAPPP
jgi:hypothetical protein